MLSMEMVDRGCRDGANATALLYEHLWPVRHDSAYKGTEVMVLRSLKSK